MDVAVAVLLAAGVLLTVVTAVGVLVVPDVFTRLHFLAPGATLGVPLICLAVVLHEGATRVSLKVAIIGALVLVAQPAVTIAAAHGLAAARGLVSGRRS